MSDKVGYKTVNKIPFNLSGLSEIIVLFHSRNKLKFVSCTVQLHVCFLVFTKRINTWDANAVEQ